MPVHLLDVTCGATGVTESVGSSRVGEGGSADVEPAAECAGAAHRAAGAERSAALGQAHLHDVDRERPTTVEERILRRDRSGAGLSNEDRADGELTALHVELTDRTAAC